MTMTSPRSSGGDEAGANEEWARVLQQFVRILSGYAPMRFVPFYYLKKHGETEQNTPRRWRTVLGLEEIQYLPEDLGPEDRESALGRTAHEVWHVLFSRPELIFDEPELIKSMAFQALWWAVEDPRVNIQGLQRHPGAKPWVMAAYARDYEIQDLEAERAQWAEEVPLHLQFNYALIYEWYKGQRDPRISDPKVSEALDRAADAIRRATRTGDAGRSFRIVRDEIWPIYKELVDEAYDREQQKQDGEGEGDDQNSSDEDSDSDSSSSSSRSSSSSKPGKPGKGGKPQQKKAPSDKVKEKMEEKEREQRDKHASKMVDKPEQMSQSEREKMKREMEQMRKKMGQKDDQQGQDAKDQQAGDPQAGEGQGEGDSQEMSAEQKAKQRERLSKPDERPKDLDSDDEDKYKEYYDRVKRFVPTARAQMLQVLKRKIRRRTIHDRKSGDLDEDSLNELPAGKPDPFTETVSANKSLYRISLLIDTSGSMSGEKRERAIEGAVMMMETLEKLPGVSYEIVAFDSRPRVIKAYTERVTPATKVAVVKALIKGSGSTESHVAVEQAIQRIRMGRGDKMIIMVNDGDPDNNFDRDQYRALVNAAKDIEIHGVGLGPDAQLVLDLFPPGKGWWLQDAADFAKNLRSIIKKKLLGGASNG
jgi:hypothetical protein